MYEVDIKKLKAEMPKRHNFEWIKNNLDKAEEIEMDFRRLERWIDELIEDYRDCDFRREENYKAVKLWMAKAEELQSLVNQKLGEKK